MKDADKAYLILLACMFIALVAETLGLALSGATFTQSMLDMMILGAVLVLLVVAGGSGLAMLHPRVRAYFAAQNRFDEHYVYETAVLVHEASNIGAGLEREGGC